MCTKNLQHILIAKRQNGSIATVFHNDVTVAVYHHHAVTVWVVEGNKTTTAVCQDIRKCLFNQEKPSTVVIPWNFYIFWYGSPCKSQTVVALMSSQVNFIHTVPIRALNESMFRSYSLINPTFPNEQTFVHTSSRPGLKVRSHLPWMEKAKDGDREKYGQIFDYKGLKLALKSLKFK